jgi:phosphoribosylglycinamide formyltransferase 1
MKKRIAIFLSGRGSNMEAISRETREGILADVCEIALVFSNNPYSAGLTSAREAGLDTLCIPSKGLGRRTFDAQLALALARYELDYIVLAGYMRIVSPPLLQHYAGRIVNIHPADTRQHQGLDGYKWAFEQGLETTMVTVHLVDAGLDTGPILDQTTVDLSGLGTVEEVERVGLAVEHKFYSQVLRDLFTSQRL